MTYGPGFGFSLIGVLYPVFFVVVAALAITLGVLLIRTLLWVIRALSAVTRERELRIDLLLADDGPAGPARPSASSTDDGPGGPAV
ncbi:hypothetical protein ITJ55_06260 [Frigoribacterium sp. VKM Ac-1396]|uniref:hypothetical protein n=1 Tax=Frigoribacterium sp. VKM Ac-1396 TaxID=2783821 RepID=UPI00188B261E|nr:hypothetical protein [Frigoribacterium sp. VKM Ac-1396]MBF4600406.1 hypothetical protein [Frigoribacterium sp. VKM Ac-1396]